MQEDLGFVKTNKETAKTQTNDELIAQYEEMKSVALKQIEDERKTNIISSLISRGIDPNIVDLDATMLNNAIVYKNSDDEKKLG